MSEYDNRLRALEWTVRAVPIDVARRLVETYHYAKGASNTAVYLHGLFRVGAFFDDECMGVAWWLPPTRSSALATYPENCEGVLALSRLVVIPDVPKNACSFLLARSVRMIDRAVWPCLVTYADEWRGHTGTIYRASNWTDCGMTKPQAVYTINGRMVSKKAGPKTRTRSEMERLGAVMVGRFAKRKYVNVK